VGIGASQFKSYRCVITAKNERFADSPDESQKSSRWSEPHAAEILQNTVCPPSPSDKLLHFESQSTNRPLAAGAMGRTWPAVIRWPGMSPDTAKDPEAVLYYYFEK